MRTTVTKSYIEVTPEAKKAIAKAFGVSEKYVYQCLTYRTGSDNGTARKIRYTAVRHHGGVAMLHCPACETLHDTTEEGRAAMRQEFKNGAVLVWYKGTPEVVVSFKGSEERFDVPSLEKFTEVQLYAESL